MVFHVVLLPALPGTRKRERRAVPARRPLIPMLMGWLFVLALGSRSGHLGFTKKASTDALSSAGSGSRQAGVAPRLRPGAQPAAIRVVSLIQEGAKRKMRGTTTGPRANHPMLEKQWLRCGMIANVPNRRTRTIIRRCRGVRRVRIIHRPAERHANAACRRSGICRLIVSHDLRHRAHTDGRICWRSASAAPAPG